MQNDKLQTQDKAIVLGGGGITGIAWESGIIASLISAGINLAEADTILGTSAGAFVGSALASGYDMEDYYAMQQGGNSEEPSISASLMTRLLWIKAFVYGGKKQNKIGKSLGRIAQNHPSKVSLDERLAIVRSRLVVKTFPPKLKVTAIDALSGETHLFDDQSGISLEQAVAASGAVPGVWPSISFNGTTWIDGGMISSTNALLVQNSKKIIILSPLPKRNGFIPGAFEDAEKLKDHAEVFLFTPDEKSKEAIGANIYDTTNCKACANAGYEQGKNACNEVLKMWR